MSANLIINSAHSVGRTCLAISADGSTIYTGGCDTLVRIWESEGGTDQEPDTALEAEDAVTALATSTDSWFSGSLDSHVRQYENAQKDMKSLVTRSSGVPVRCIACDPKGQKVAVGSDELAVKLIDINDNTSMRLLQGHKRGVRGLAWHPSGNLLTSCGADGKIITWIVSSDEPTIEKELDGFLPVLNDTEAEEYGRDCPVVWHTSGQYLIVATTAHELITISRSTWSKIATFSEEESLGEVTCLALSINGVYLATASKAGIIVWSTANRRIISRQPTGSEIIYQLAFSPKHNILAWTNGEGILTRWKDVIPSSAPSPTKAISLGTSEPVRRAPTPLFGQDVDPSGDVDLDDADPTDGDLPDEDWIIDDLDGGLEDKPDREYGKGGLREMVSVTKAQPAFQPGSTPLVNKRRYLAFNTIGVVEVVDQDSQQIINVEFFDQSTRKNYHFSEDHKSDLAAIGERGIVYAAPADAVYPAKITYKPYATWATQSEWTYSLPKGEKAVAVAAGGTAPLKSLRTPVETDIEGNGYVAVATNKGIVRFFSGGGMQRGPVWAVDGDIVTMVAARDYVFVVHREGGASLDGNQNLKYTLMTTDTFRVLHTGRLPVNKGHTLKWAGISDEGAPVIYDSAERVMMLQHFRFTSQGSWVVLLDATTLERREGKDESYWPIGVSKSTFMCIILKGREEFPGFPRPLVQEIDMYMPYLDLDSGEAQKEERLAREDMLLDSIRDAMDDETLTMEDISRTELDMDKEIIQLIQLAIKNDKLQRALDATKLLHHTASFDMASKIAEFYHLSGLQAKIAVLKEARLASDRLREQRDRRKDWRSASGPVPVAPRENYVELERRHKTPFQDARPAPAISRSRLTVAAPLVEPSPFSSNSRQVIPDTPVRPAEAISPPSADGKRKRDENTDVDMDCEYDSGAKRRSVDVKSTTAAAKPNPFAKKAKASENDSNNANPFLRKLTSNKSMHRSDTFFDKVNAAEDEIDKGKRRNTKVGQKTKQTTLFGFAGADGKKSDLKKKASSVDNTKENSQSTESQETIGGDDEETQVETQVETQEAYEESALGKETTANLQFDIETEGDPFEWEPSPPGSPRPVEV